MKTVSEYFGSLVFDDKVMQERLSPETYALLKRTVQDGRSLNLSVANAVAAAMKDWAVEHGATHYSLVSTYDGDYRRKTRQLYLSRRKRPSFNGIFSQRIGTRRT